MNKDVKELERTYNIRIPQKRIDIWRIQEDMWQHFDEVCKKNNLIYYVMFGGLLGAVRHKGFIPWDDDIDVMMPRTDYDKLMSLGDEFSFPYYLQTPYNSRKCIYSNMLIIDERTMCLNPVIECTDQHQGIKLDIVPLDGYPEKEICFKLDKFRYRFWDTMGYLYFCNRKKLKKRAKIVALFAKILFLICDYSKVALKKEKIRSRYSWEDNSQIGDMSHGLFFDKEDFLNTTELQFEEYMIPAPLGYDNVLKNIYGDYMILPSEKDRDIPLDEANGYILDPYKSYKDIGI